ncbi:hypothetical protein Tco_1161983 [Tanacetum coccineum]
MVLNQGVPDEPKGKSIDINEGTGLKLGVLDVSKANSSKSEYESYSDSGDEDNVKGDDEDVLESDDDLKQADDERTDSENQKTTEEDKESDDSFVHALVDYVPTGDETNDVDEEEYERISEELYGDVNVRLTDAESADEEKGNKEMTNAEIVNAEHEKGSQAVAGEQVKDDAQETVTATLDAKKTKVLL